MVASSLGEDMEQLARWEFVGIIQINMYIPTFQQFLGIYCKETLGICV